MKKLLIILFLWTQLIALVINPGTDIRTTTGSDISFGATIFNKRFITFDGSDYADVSAFIPSDVLGGSEFSISLWKDPTTGYLLGSIDNEANAFFISAAGPGTIIVKLGSVVQSFVISAKGDWENLILTYNKTDLMLYLDNVYEDTKVISDMSDNYSIYGILIGACNDNGTPVIGIGHIDEIAIYDKVLTVEDRAIIMGDGTVQTAGDCREISDLKAYWRFEEKAGSAVLDWAE